MAYSDRAVSRAQRIDEIGDDRVESLYGRVLDASGDVALYD